MPYTTPAQHKSIAAFRAHLQALDAEFDCVDQPRGASGPLGEPLDCAGKSLRNRFAIHPMEGWDGTPDGKPGELTLQRWHRFGASGAALIWGGEAVAVCAEGRANPSQLYLNPSHSRASLALLMSTLRRGQRAIGYGEQETLVGLQLTHSGRFARPAGALAPRLVAHHPVLDARLAIDPNAALLSDGELEAIGSAFVDGARLAREAGFDFVDVKCCHGYLLHELLGARTRPGAYGGSFLNRTRLVRAILQEIQREAPDLAIGVRLSFGDLVPFVRDERTGCGRPSARPEVPGGFGICASEPLAVDTSEPEQVLLLLQSLGVRLLNVTLGSPYYCPHLQRPAAYPPSDGYEPPEDPLLSVIRHLRATRQAKRTAPTMVVVGTGYTYLQEWLAHVAEYELDHGHVDFIGLGRMALSYPDLPRSLLAGETPDRKRICRTFSDCTSAPRNGLVSGCYPLDPAYKALPQAAELRRLKLAAKHSGRG